MTRVEGTLVSGDQSGPFVLLIAPNGSWRLTRQGLIESSDGSRVLVESVGADPRWLDLGPALVRQGELEVAFGAWGHPGSRWQARTTPSGDVELLRGWAAPAARLQIGPDGIEAGAVDPGPTTVRFDPRQEPQQRIELRRPSANKDPNLPDRTERWTIASSTPQWSGGTPTLLEPPGDLGQDTTSPVRPPIEIPVEVAPNGYLLVRPLLDGVDVGPFLFDTAASVSCIDRTAAQRLGWKDMGATRVQGVGGPDQARWLLSGAIELGALERTAQPLIELDLAGLQAFRLSVLGGLIGADWLRGSVVVVDHAKSRIVFHDRRSAVHGDWPWQPMLVEGGAPCVELRCAPWGQGWFRLDTGSNDSVTVQSTELRRALYPLRATFLELDQMRLGGIGGAARARRGELPWIELGDRRFTEVPASVVTDSQGPLASPFLIGTLGTGLLRLRPYAIDMDGRRIAFLGRKIHQDGR